MPEFSTELKVTRIIIKYRWRHDLIIWISLTLEIKPLNKSIMKTTETNSKTKQSSLVSTIEDFRIKDESFTQLDKMKPEINIIEKNGVYKIKVLAPGFKRKDFKLTIQGRDLIISAEHNTEKKEEYENYLRNEFSTSSFSRSFRLPDNISLNQIKSNYKDGLLNIAIKKKALDNQEVQEIKIR